ATGQRRWSTTSATRLERKFMTTRIAALATVSTNFSHTTMKPIAYTLHAHLPPYRTQLQRIIWAQSCLRMRMPVYGRRQRTPWDKPVAKKLQVSSFTLCQQNATA